MNKNLVANFFGQIYTGLITIIFFPLYIEYLGIESFGIISFYILVQTWFNLLDLGMSPTLTREFAVIQNNFKSIEKVQNILRSFEILIFSLAIISMSLIVFSSSYIVESWLNIENLNLDIVTKCIIIIGILVGSRLLEAIYKGSLLGLNKHVHYNVFNIFIVSFRVLGSVFLLMYFEINIYQFFLWQLLSSIFSLTGLIILTYKFIPKINLKPKFSFQQLSTVKNYTTGMFGITLLGMILMHSDKIIISKIMTVSEFGEYNLGVTVAGLVFYLSFPVVQTWFPIFCNHLKNKNEEKLIYNFHLSSQIISIFSSTFTLVVLFFSYDILIFWVNDEILVNAINPIIKLITLGNFFNIIYSIPYQLQLSFGWTKLSLNLNVVITLIFIPLLLFIVPIMGYIGAGYAWFFVNMIYFFIGIPLMFNKILIKEKWNWFFRDFFKPILISGFVLLLSYYPITLLEISQKFKIFIIFLMSILSILISCYYTNILKIELIEFFKKYRKI